MRTALSAFFVLLAPAFARAEVHTYECAAMPTNVGWSVGLNWCNPDEWVEDGQFFQYVQFCPGFDPPQGQQSSYTYPLVDFVGAQAFWMEAVVVTDGDSSELIYVAPVSLLIGNNSVNYQFVVSDDRVRFLRDATAIYFDITPRVPHTYRVEVLGDELYVVWIDGDVVDTGPPEADQFTHPVLASDSEVWFRTKAKLVESTTVWSYIRWGQLQPQGSLDFAMDSAIDYADFPYIHECLTTPAGSWAGCAWADGNFDGQVTCDDWGLFLAA